VTPDFLRALLAAERHGIKVAPCMDCGEHCLDRLDPLVLVEGSSPPRCLYHVELAEGRPGTQGHHVGGRPSPLVLPVNVNSHKRLTTIQELAWRLGVEPGTPAAVLVDVLAMNAVLALGTEVEQ